MLLIHVINTIQVERFNAKRISFNIIRKELNELYVREHKEMKRSLTAARRTLNRIISVVSAANGRRASGRHCGG